MLRYLYLFSFAFLLAVFRVPNAEAAIGFHFGFGPQYTDYRVASDPVRGSYTHRGPGYELNLRTRFAPPRDEYAEGMDLGFDVLGVFHQAYANNITTNLDETSIRIGWGAGFEIFYYYAYLGFVYHWERSAINAPNSRRRSLVIYYNPISARVGGRIHLSEIIDLKPGIEYKIGIAQTNNSQNKISGNIRVNEALVTVMMELKIF